MKYTLKENPPAIPTIDEANADPGWSALKPLALVAPGLIAIEAGPAPWAISEYSWCARDWCGRFRDAARYVPESSSRPSRGGRYFDEGLRR